MKQQQPILKLIYTYVVTLFQTYTVVSIPLFHFMVLISLHK